MALFKETPTTAVRTEQEVASRTSLIAVALYVDADSLVYKAAHVGARNYENAQAAQPKNGLFQYIQRTLLEEQMDVFDTMEESIFKDVNDHLLKLGLRATEYKMVLTPKAAVCEALDLKHNFRYDLVKDYNKKYGVNVPEYKANRVGAPVPEGVDDIYRILMSRSNVIWADGCEADDYVYKVKMDNPAGVILACIDKDILMSIANKSIHFLL